MQYGCKKIFNIDILSTECCYAEWLIINYYAEYPGAVPLASFPCFQYYEFAYIKELAEPSRQLAQKVSQKEKGKKETEETTGSEQIGKDE